jgi:hypothetical protein
MARGALYPAEKQKQAIIFRPANQTFNGKQ